MLLFNANWAKCGDLSSVSRAVAKFFAFEKFLKPKINLDTTFYIVFYPPNIGHRLVDQSQGGSNGATARQKIDIIFVSG